jgi:hypothetical protein
LEKVYDGVPENQRTVLIMSKKTPPQPILCIMDD